MRTAALLLSLTVTVAAQPTADRTTAERLEIVGAVAVPLTAAASLLGYTDGLHNARAWCVDAHGYSDPACLALNRDWHVTAAGGRALVLVTVGSAVATATVADLTPAEGALVTASASALAGMAFNLAHNAQQGQPYYYAGEVAATDRAARALGPRAVFWASAAVTAAVVVVTVVAL